MPKFRKRPIIVDADQWFEYGDHPEDHSNNNMIVYSYRPPPSDNGERKCDQCTRKMKAHGWVCTLEGGHIVCPGDWIITGIAGERYPCKDPIFQESYDLVEDDGPKRGDQYPGY